MAMHPEEARQRVRKLRLTARRLIHTFGEGSFRTLFHGRGIEFASLREYVPGDDIRQIEWNTTARRGTPYVKTFVEERDLSILLAVDLSASMRSKQEAVFKIVALLTSLASFNEDRIGILGFSEKVEFFLPPAKHPLQPERLLHLLIHHKSALSRTSISQALNFLRRVLKKHCILFLISDFLDHRFEQPLLTLSKKHEIVGIYLYDFLEVGFPGSAILDCFEPETGARYLIDGYHSKTRNDYAAFIQKQKQFVFRLFSQSRADALMTPASQKADLHLVEFLRRRQISRAPIAETIFGSDA